MHSTVVPSFEETMEVQVQVQIEEEPSMGQEEANQENEILLYLEEKKFESKPNLEVILSIIHQSHSYHLHCPNLRIEATITVIVLITASARRSYS